MAEQSNLVYFLTMTYSTREKFILSLVLSKFYAQD